MATESFSYTITYSNNIYRVYQATNGDLLCDFPTSQMVMKTHPSAATLFYLGSNINLITLDYTLCTNLANGTRVILMDAIVALSTGVPLGTVTISGQPIDVNLNPNLGENYSLGVTVASTNANALVIRPGAGLTKLKLLYLTAATSTALSSGTKITIKQGQSVIGGAWAADASITGSQVEVNTGGAISGGSVLGIYYFGTDTIVNLSNLNLNFTALQNIVIGITQSGIGSTSASIQWSETP